MAGGGKWELQNKVRPGAYFNFESNNLNTMGLDSAGALVIPAKFNWGEVGKFIKVGTGTRFTEAFGKSLAEIVPIREAFKATGNVYVYNLNGEGTKASATSDTFKATAVHGGSDGNKIQVTVTVGLDESTVRTFFDSEQVSIQKVTNGSELAANAYVSFEGDLPLNDVTLNLTGGTTVEATNEHFSDFVSALDALEFKVVAFGTDDPTIKALLSLKVKEFRENAGKNVTFVTNDYNAADHESTISVKNGVYIEGNEHLPADKALYGYAAAYAASTVNSLTYSKYPGAIDCEPLTHDEIVAALNAGHIVFTKNHGDVVVEQDINTFRSFTPKKNQQFRKGKIVRGMDIIQNNIQYIFTKYFIGKVNNDPDGEGRDLFKKEIMKSVLDPFQRAGVIGSYVPEDIQIQQGDESDAVFVEMDLFFVDAMEKLYVRVNCK